jgi:FKBP-type peptidyl-prolyl cis-trans isomerase (trigger factor)
MDVKTYLEHLKTTEDIFKKEQIEPVAKKRVQSMLIMEALKKHYAPEIADDVIVTEIRKVFARYAHNADFESRILDLAKPGTEHFIDVKNRLEYRAVIDRFLK